MLLMSAGIVAADQLTKLWVVRNIPLQGRMDVLPGMFCLTCILILLGPSQVTLNYSLKPISNVTSLLEPFWVLPCRGSSFLLFAIS